jgi:hypothetical protein
MSRYLRRVLARTTGQPLGSLQAARPLRWSNSSVDALSAADRTAEPTVAQVDRATATSGPRSSPSAARSTPGGSVVEDGGMPEVRDRARSAAESARPAPLHAPPVERSVRSARPERHARFAYPAPSDDREPEASSAATAARMPAAPGARDPATAKVAVSVPPLVSVAAPPPASSRPRDVFGRDEPSPLAMPLPPGTPRRDPTTAIARPALHDLPVGGSARPGAPSIAAPPSQPVAPQPAPPRAEVVIGRISVVVESARPPAAATRTIVRHATAAPADDGAGPMRFGRFGMGQL